MISAVSNSTIQWETTLEGKGFELLVHGSVDFDSYIDFNVTVVATSSLSLSDIRLHFDTSQAKYMIGMGSMYDATGCISRCDQLKVMSSRIFNGLGTMTQPSTAVALTWSGWDDQKQAHF